MHYCSLGIFGASIRGSSSAFIASTIMRTHIFQFIFDHFFFLCNIRHVVVAKADVLEYASLFMPVKLIYRDRARDFL
jgi:hypothetical protein